MSTDIPIVPLLLIVWGSLSAGFCFGWIVAARLLKLRERGRLIEYRSRHHWRRQKP